MEIKTIYIILYIITIIIIIVALAQADFLTVHWSRSCTIVDVTYVCNKGKGGHGGERCFFIRRSGYLNSRVGFFLKIIFRGKM